MIGWISSKERLPRLGQFILAVRDPYPSFYWMGFYKGVPNEDEDMFDWWVPLPDLPNE